MRILAFVFVLLCLGCASDDAIEDCAEVLCAPQNLMLQFVSADSGVDVFGAGILEAENVVIRDLDTESAVFYEVISIGSTQDVLFGFVGKADGAVTNYNVSYDGAFDLDISFVMTVNPGSGCCAQISYDAVAFSGLQGDASDEFLDTYVIHF